MDNGAREPFDPAQHLTNVGGNPYLEVKFRLVWFRDVFPDGQIRTELVRLENKESYDRNGQIFRTALAVFRAEVTTGQGGVATGWGSETEADFRDHIEKAESKAIGRALAALGFGTQFSGAEWSGEAGADRPVDAPLNRPQSEIARPQQPYRAPQGQQSYQGGGQQQSGFRGDPNAPASPKQHDYIRDLLKNNGYNEEDFNFTNLKSGEASEWIAALKTGNIPDFAQSPN